MRQQWERHIDHRFAAGELTPVVRRLKVPLAQRHVDLPERGGQLMIAIARPGQS